ncbi:MAG: hypothetical protein AAF391_14005, partial [Bacteroidota bacterium]
MVDIAGNLEIDMLQAVAFGQYAALDICKVKMNRNVAWIQSSVPSVWFNFIFYSRARSEQEENLRILLDYLSDGTAPSEYLETPFSRPADLGKMLGRLGFECTSQPLGMRLVDERMIQDQKLNSRTKQISRAISAGDIRSWSAAFCRFYGVNETLEKHLQNLHLILNQKYTGAWF